MKKQLVSLNGTTGSRLAFGTMQFGGAADLTASREMFDDAVNAGITHFDTAYVYTGGQSEKILGSFIKDMRDNLLIATKVDFIGGASRENMTRAFDVSRKRLSQDTVDILYLHRFDPDTDLHETMETFAELKNDGKIRYVGLSNFAAWQVVKAIFIAEKFGLDVDIVQPMYSLVKRQAEVEILPMCMDQHVICAPYSPLGGGLLTGKYNFGETGRLTEDNSYAKRYGLDWMHATAGALSEIAREVGTNAATLAVAWAAAHPAKPTPIVSARTAAQLAPSLAAMTYKMSSELYVRLASLSPTPPPATDRTEELET